MSSKRLFNWLMMSVFMTAGAILGACSDDPEEPEIPGVQPPVPVETGVELTASATTLIADGTDEVVFTVTDNGEDVTDRSVIMCNAAKMATNVFTTTEAGVYEFYAVYDGEVTDKVRVVAEADPEQYDGFRRRVLAIQTTGLWCGYCPRLTAGMHLFKVNDSNPDDVVFVTAHYSDILAGKAAETVNGYIGIGSGIPQMKLNLDRDFVVETNNTPTVISANIRRAATTVLRTPAKTCIKAAVSQPDENGNITVDAEVKVGVAGNYRVAAWLLEDKVPGTQNDPYKYGSQVGIDVNSHENVLRAISSTMASGVLLGPLTGCPVKSVQTFSHVFDTGACDVTNPANCRVLVLVTRSDSGTYTVDNVVQLGLGENCDYEYNK